MTINGAVWFIVGGILGCILGGITAFNVALVREYSEPNDYYELDPIEIQTPSYEDMLEYDQYDEF